MTTNWVTKTGGAGAVLTGAAMIAKAVSDQDWKSVLDGLMVISGGVVAIGLGRKVERVVATLISIVSAQKNTGSVIK